MPPKLKRLSGVETVKILSIFGFQVVSQRGSHIKLRRLTPKGERQTLTVPSHHELDIGTLRAIIRQASRYIDLDKLRDQFYTD